MPGHDIIVIGASAGGVETLAELARGLPPELPASLFVVHHFPAHGTSVLPSILNRAGPLPAAHAEGNEPIVPGRIYVAPPNYHMLIKPGRVQLVRGPRENGHRPAIDPLFRSAALAYGPQVVGVILSGTLDDGSEGLAAVKKRGGVAVVQDPEEALYSGMPRSALEYVAVDHVARIAEMPALLETLARSPVKEGMANPVSNEMENEEAVAEMDLKALGEERHPGTPANLGCPECGGTLWELSEGDLLRFRCRVGHAFTADALLVEQTEALEAALWTALRALEERTCLARRLAERAHRKGHSLAAQRFDRDVRETDQRAAIIREVLVNSDILEPVPSYDEGVSGESGGRAGGHPPPRG